jgi:phytanoyl-CoA hydroxylase
MEETLTEEQWSQYTSRGYVRLGKTLAATELSVLQKRMDDIMMGRAPLEYDRMLMQLDRDAPGPESQGHKGATLSYRRASLKT